MFASHRCEERTSRSTCLMENLVVCYLVLYFIHDFLPPCMHHHKWWVKSQSLLSFTVCILREREFSLFLRIRFLGCVSAQLVKLRFIDAL